MPKIIPIQTEFSSPRVFLKCGPNYNTMVQDLDFISDTIRSSGIEPKIMQHFLDRLSDSNKGKALSRNKIIKAQKKGLFILYAMVLRDYLKLSLRGFERVLAASELFQSFCGINSWACIDIPTHQEINALENSLSDSLLRAINVMLVKDVVLNEMQTKKLGLERKFDLNKVLTDSTCIKANIHYPVDYLLMRDMIRTSMLKIERIREVGLKLRMPCTPKEWLSQTNSLIIEMSMASRKIDSMKRRKRIFRAMKRLFKQAMSHVERYLDGFEKNYHRYEISTIKAESIVISLKEILSQKDEVVSIANRRIIKEEKVDSEDKILSIYEKDVNIIIRNKDGSKVEFGNTLQFVEQSDGFIIDYELLKDPSKGDAEGCIDSLNRIVLNYGEVAKSLKHLIADRGYDAKKLKDHVDQINEKYKIKLEYDVLPRNPKQLKEKMKDKKYAKLHTRRSSTEAKVAHVKIITDNPMKQKGIRNRQIHLGIAVFSHNLMKLARIYREQESKKRETA